MRDMLLSVRDLDLETRFFQIRDRCLTVLRGLFALAIPLTIVNIWFACIYAWIYANQVRWLAFRSVPGGLYPSLGPCVVSVRVSSPVFL